AAGSVMHSMGDVIDMRRFSGLRKALPITHWTFLAGAAALAGVPLLTGFWSKDEILAVLHEAGEHERYGGYFTVIYWIATITAFLTAFYTFRAYFMTFWGPERFPPEAGHHPHDAPPTMAWPLRILAIPALAIGAAVAATHWFGQYIARTPGFVHGEHAFHLDLMITSGLIALAGIALAWFMYLRSPQTPALVAHSVNRFLLYDLSARKFFLDELYAAVIVLPLRAFARLCYLIDVFVIDRIVDTVGALPRIVSAAPRMIHTGLVSNYALMMWVGLLACLTYMIGLFE
ncbi:MAG TPA: proton-conducting transporter membrane subunit, partial [Lacipirellula sp.]